LQSIQSVVGAVVRYRAHLFGINPMNVSLFAFPTMARRHADTRSANR